MTETKHIVRCALAFILAILALFCATFGLETKNDAETKKQSSVESTQMEDEEESVEASAEKEVTDSADDNKQM